MMNKSGGSKTILIIAVALLLGLVLWHFDLLSFIGQKNLNSAKTTFLGQWGKTLKDNFHHRCQQSLKEIHDDQNLKLALNFCKKEIAKIFSSSLRKIK